MTANYYNSTSPDAIFVQQLLVVTYNSRGRKILSGNRLKVIEKDSVTVKEYLPEEIPALLKEEFGFFKKDTAKINQTEKANQHFKIEFGEEKSVEKSRFGA